jgi:hypothetical protein
VQASGSEGGGVLDDGGSPFLGEDIQPSDIPGPEK